MGEKTIQVFFKFFGKRPTHFFAQRDQPLFAGMGLAVQGKKKVEIGFQESGYTVVDADLVTPAEGFLDLQLIGRQVGTEQLPVVINDVCF